jgi:hypothetical protein
MPKYFYSFLTLTLIIPAFIVFIFPFEINAQEPLNDYDDKETTDTPGTTQNPPAADDKEDPTNFITSPLPGTRPIRPIEETPPVDPVTPEPGTNPDGTPLDTGTGIIPGTNEEPDVEVVIPVYVISPPGCSGCDVIEDLADEFPIEVVYLDPLLNENQTLIENLKRLINAKDGETVVIIGENVMSGFNREMLIKYINYILQNGSPNIISQLLFAGARDKLLDDNSINAIKVYELNTDGTPSEVLVDNKNITSPEKLKVEKVINLPFFGSVPVKSLLILVTVELLLLAAFIIGTTVLFSHMYFEPAIRKIIRIGGVTLIILIGFVILYII